MDRKQLTTALAAVFMVSVLAAVSLRLWASTARNSMPQLAMAHAGPDGGLYTMLGDTLYIDDADGNSKSVIPLSRLGISAFWGDFAVLADGELILPASKQPKDSLGKEARIALRAPASGGDRSGAVPLIRCAVEALSCQPLTGSPAADYFQADRTFKLAVDEAAGRIYVADTAEQRLLILDLQGHILAKQTSGLQFPNQLVLLQPGLLEVADTNGLALRRYDVSADSFVAKDEPEPTLGWGRGLMHDFPVGLAADKHGGQWVLLTDGAIEHGELYRRASETDRPQRLPLPENADVLFLTAAGYHVLAPDQTNYAIHAFSLDGEALPDAGSDTLQAALAGYASTRRLYDALFSYSLTVLVVVLGLLFLAYRVIRIYGLDREVEGEAVEPLPAGTPQAPAMAWSGREFVFCHRMSGVLNPRSRRLVLGSALAMFALGVAPLLWMLYRVQELPHHHTMQLQSTRSDSDLIMLVVISVIAAVWYIFSRKYERLHLSHTGIRYTTWLGGPLTSLAALYPDWHLRWDELSDIRLLKRKGTRNAQFWYYELTPRQGKARRLGAAAWRMEGEADDMTLTFRQALRRDPAVLKAAFAQTRLFRLLDLTMRARKGQFQHPLVESE